MKIYPASFSRASNGALSKVLDEMRKEGLLTESVEEADYIMAVGDRWETYNFVFPQWQSGKRIIHLWAGECTPASQDEIHRTAMTLMSDMQMCTNEESKQQTERICELAGKEPNAHVVGNVMMENLDIDESVFDLIGVKDKEYDLVLYNPLLGHIKEDMAQIMMELTEGLLEDKPLNGTGKFPFIWIRPNIDRGFEFLSKYATSSSQPRPKFLALIKHCRKFITNSSCMYYEAPFLIDKSQIINIGLRNKFRNSSKARMDIPGATKNIIKSIRSLREQEDKKEKTF